jgi:hypothetical protein
LVRQKHFLLRSQARFENNNKNKHFSSSASLFRLALLTFFQLNIKYSKAKEEDENDEEDHHSKAAKR